MLFCAVFFSKFNFTISFFCYQIQARRMPQTSSAPVSNGRPGGLLCEVLLLDGSRQKFDVEVSFKYYFLVVFL